MEESYSARPLFGRFLALDLRPTRPLTFLGPGAAVLCGAVTSGGLALHGQSLLFLIFSLLLGDVLLGAWRALWLQTEWRDALRRSTANQPSWYSPSAEAGGWRIVRWLRRTAQRVRYLRKVVLPLIDSEIVGMFMVGVLALSVAAVLGQAAVALTLVAMVFALIEGQVGEARGAGLRAVFEIALPWLIAQSAFGYFSWRALFYILLFTLVYRALLGLSAARQDKWIAWNNLALVAAALVLFASNAPVNAGVVALGLLAQVLWQARYRVNRDGRAYAQQVQSYVLVAMLAVGLSLWL
ncbi:MAG: hypothetical protein KGJ80_01705 [Chloroflexota bacterium]|nr:hypothetical protein [Chloroflexota bacterium]